MGFAVRGSDGAIVLSETDRWRRRTREPLAAEAVLEFNAAFPTRLEPGSYEVSPLIAPPGEPGLIEARAGAVPVEVAGNGARSRAARAAAARADDRPSRRDQVRRFTDLSISMARAEFKLRYLDSAIGYAWALGQPLLMYAVLYAIWTNVIHRGDDVAHYPLKLLLAIVLFTFFSEATGSALPSLLSKGSMLRKIPFPPLVVPLSTLITTGFAYGLSLLIVLGLHPGERDHALGGMAGALPAPRAADRVHRRRRALCSRWPTW